MAYVVLIRLIALSTVNTTNQIYVFTLEQNLCLMFYCVI